MSVKYRAIAWDAQKRRYDRTLLMVLALAVVAYVGVSLVANPHLTRETLILRSTALSALVLLHVILCIGPLARLDRRWAPLLYNRRHLGVTMFLLALIHAAFATIQFHALGDANPLVSVFSAYAQDYRFWRPGASFADVPFEPFGALALVILFLLAATSHDFWLRNLGASLWKTLHIGVYLAYGAILVHVALGAMQTERSLVYPGLLAVAFVVVVGLHLLAGWRERSAVQPLAGADENGYQPACKTDELVEGRARTVMVDSQRVAVWLHQGRAFATANVCRHQGGPLAEGKIIDGCITCPWHGWTYRPGDGCSPPPFSEVIPTYAVRVVGDTVYVHPSANELGAASVGEAVANSPATISDDAFYVGYLPQAPPVIACFTRRRVAVLTALVTTVMAVIALAQLRAHAGRFEHGRQLTFTGVLYESPLPLLQVSVATADAAAPARGVSLLVGFGKAGLPAFARGHHGHQVRFRGSLIYDHQLTMIEMNDAASFVDLGQADSRQARPPKVELGAMTIRGELVDTKCFLGVMRPGEGKIHRACAVRCLSGGVPPGLLVRDATGHAVVIMLAGADGAPLACEPQWAARTVIAEGALEIVEQTPVLRTTVLKLAGAGP